MTEALKTDSLFVYIQQEIVRYSPVPLVNAMHKLNTCM